MAAASLPPSEPDDGKDATTEEEVDVQAEVEEYESTAAAGVPRDRIKLAESVQLDPGSLVGSWFLRFENGEIVWHGIVVGEVQAGHYLLSVRGLVGALRSKTQVVLTLDRMIAKDEGYEFRFFDSREQMLAASYEYETPPEGGE